MQASLIINSEAYYSDVSRGCRLQRRRDRRQGTLEHSNSRTFQGLLKDPMNLLYYGALEIVAIIIITCRLPVTLNAESAESTESPESAPMQTQSRPKHLAISSLSINIM